MSGPLEAASKMLRLADDGTQTEMRRTNRKAKRLWLHKMEKNGIKYWAQMHRAKVTVDQANGSFIL